MGCTTTTTSRIVNSPLVGARFAGAPSASNDNPVPIWAYQPPKPDKMGVFGVGSGQASTLDEAMAKANSAAKLDLANGFVQALYGSDSKQKDDDTANQLHQQRTQLIYSVVEQAPDVDYSRSEQQALMKNNLFTAYSQLKLSYINLYNLLDKQVRYTSGTEVNSKLQEIQQKVKQRLTSG